MISANMAKIQLNGKKITINQNFSLFDLLKKYKLNEKKIAIELNGQIITKKMYKKRLVKHNDKIEIVHFIGGG
jgi:sulfur carrier protein